MSSTQHTVFEAFQARLLELDIARFMGDIAVEDWEIERSVILAAIWALFESALVDGANHYRKLAEAAAK